METYRGEAYQDIQIASWWHALVASGEIRQTFSPEIWPLGAFMAYWRGTPRQLILYAGERYAGPAAVASDVAPWAACWFEPMLDGAAIGFWITPAVRHTRSALRVVELFHEAGFARWPVLVAVTRQEKLLRAAGALGYTTIGYVPGIWEGGPVWIAHLTETAFRERVCRWQRPQRQANHGGSRPGALGVHPGVD